MKNKPTLLLIWHEAGNPLYTDRFIALSKYFDVTVFGFSRFQNVNYESIKMDSVMEFKLYNPLLSGHWLTVFSIKMFVDIYKGSYDYIYIHEEPHSLISFVTTFLSKKSKVIIDAAIINLKLNFTGYNFFERYVYRNVSKIFYRNKDVKRILIARGACRNKLVDIIGNGVSGNIFSQDKLMSRKNNDKYTVGYAGRIWKWKGLELLISLSQKKNIKIKVCGPVKDIWLKTKLEENGVEVLGKLNGEELCNFYRSLDLFILPSLESPGWTEQFGRVIVESVFSGTPAIGSSTGFIPNLVGANAVFESGNQLEMLKLIDKYQDLGVRETLFIEQHKRLSAEYSWEGIASKVNACIRGKL